MKQLPLMEYPNASKRKKTPLHDQVIAALSNFTGQDLCDVLLAARGGRLREQVELAKRSNGNPAWLWENAVTDIVIPEVEELIWKRCQIVGLLKDTVIVEYTYPGAPASQQKEDELKLIRQHIGHYSVSFNRLLGREVDIRLEVNRTNFKEHISPGPFRYPLLEAFNPYIETLEFEKTVKDGQGTGTKIEGQERKPLARMDLTN